MGKIKHFCWILWGWILAFLLTVQSVNSPVSKNYAYSDYAVYQYVARIMSEGGMPYRDTFDHKGPAFYLLNTLGYMIHPTYGMWAIDFLLMFGTVVYAYKIARKALNAKFSSFIVTAVLSGISAWGYWIGNTPESCILFFLMMTMYLFVEYTYSQTLTDWQILLIGLSCVLALLFKPTFLAMFSVLIIEVLFETVKRKDYAFLRRCLLMFSIPFFGLVIIIAGWLGMNDALSECISQYIIFNAKYSSVAKRSMWKAAYAFLERPVIVFGLFCIWVNFMRWDEYTNTIKHLLASAYITWALVFYVSVMPGRPYEQYTLLFYPMILVIVIFACKDLDRHVRIKGTRRGVGILAVALITGIILFPDARETMANIQNNAQEQKVKVEVTDYFSHVPGDYEISVVSPEDNWVYLQTGHHSATKYSYTQADLIYENVESDFIEEYSAEINENRPRFIVERCRSSLYSSKIAGYVEHKYEEVFRNSDYVVYEIDVR